MLINIKEYVTNRSQDERQIHLRLDEDCINRGGNSTSHRGVLAEYLSTEIGGGVDLCHACHNGKCSNPRHLYWGTRKENVADSIANGTHNGVWQSMVNKYGYEEACRINKLHCDPVKAGRGNKGKTKTVEHRKKISESIKQKHADNLYADKNHNRSGRPPAMDKQELIDLVAEYGLKKAASLLGLTFSAAQGRYYRYKG